MQTAIEFFGNVILYISCICTEACDGHDTERENENVL